VAHAVLLLHTPHLFSNYNHTPIRLDPTIIVIHIQVSLPYFAIPDLITLHTPCSKTNRMPIPENERQVVRDIDRVAFVVHEYENILSTQSLLATLLDLGGILFIHFHIYHIPSTA
jgi:hypothetical protein